MVSEEEEEVRFMAENFWTYGLIKIMEFIILFRLLYY